MNGGKTAKKRPRTKISYFTPTINGANKYCSAHGCANRKNWIVEKTFTNSNLATFSLMPSATGDLMKMTKDPTRVTKSAQNSKFLENRKSTDLEHFTLSLAIKMCAFCERSKDA